MSESFYVLLHLCILFGSTHLKSVDRNPFFFLSDNFFVHPLHLPSQGSPFSLLCAPFQATIWSILSSPELYVFFLFNVIDSSSSMHAWARCSITESVTGKSYLRVVGFSFFPNRSKLKDIGGWVGGELGVGCRAIFNVGGRPA